MSAADVVADVRWLIERPGDGYRFEDVGAQHVEFPNSGGLIFRDAGGRLLVAYAPGSWVTVVPDGDRS